MKKYRIENMETLEDRYMEDRDGGHITVSPVHDDGPTIAINIFRQHPTTRYPKTITDKIPCIHIKQLSPGKHHNTTLILPISHNRQLIDDDGIPHKIVIERIMNKFNKHCAYIDKYNTILSL